MKRLVVILAAAAMLAAPAGARAGTTSYEPGSYALGPAGGDQWNRSMADPATGEMTVVRANPTPGAFNCGGAGGFANFAVGHTATATTRVVVSYADAIIDPYTWINVGVRQGDGYLASTVARGLTLGDGDVTVDLPAPASGPITVWFGIQVASACPNVDGGHATFTSVTITDA